MPFSAGDHQYMSQALRLARRGLLTTDPNPAVGCVIVAADGTVAGEGWHERAGEAHAEVRALREAGAAARGSTAYVTLEPCSHHGRTPPCADALLAAGVTRVVCAMQDPNPQVAGQGLAQLRAAGLAVECGLLEPAARELNRGFIARMQTGRPWVSSKLAVGLDGRTAMQSGESKWITGEAARAEVHRMRACNSAVLTGIGTVLADDPRLDVRRDDLGEYLPPLRIVVDSQLRLPANAALLKTAAELWIYHAQDATAQAQKLTAAGVVLRQAGAGVGRVDLEAMLDDLGRRGINRVLVEAGPTLNGALLTAGLLDEIVVFQAARIMGDQARGMFALDAVARMAETVELRLVDVRRVGEDLRLTYRKN